MTNELMPITAKEMQLQVNSIQEMMGQVMKDGTHYGKVPGCGEKPALLKAGAEKLGLMFGLSALFKIELNEMQHGHREYSVVCTLKSRSGFEVGQGVGCCSTMESKYRYRKGERKCPVCGAEAIIKGKAEYGGGWICFEKKGGCKAKFADGDKAIEGQQVGKLENPDIADTYNTVLKMAKKRAHVDAILTTTAASDIFTQDIEEFADAVEVKPTETKPAAKTQPVKDGPEFAYSIPYNESKKINPKSLGLRWDAAAKVWRGKEVPDLNIYLDMTKSAPAQADLDDNFDPNAYEGAY